MAREKNINQIVRKDGKNCFVEIMSSAFEIDKVLLNFYNYNMDMPANNRRSAGVSIYLSFDEFYRICYDATMNYRLVKLLNDSFVKMKETGAKYPEPITLYMGGKTASSLQKAGKARPDGKSLSRQLQIVRGMKYPIVLQALSGPGEENEKGLIVPKYNFSNAEEVVKIPLTQDAFEEMLLITKAHMDAYIAAKYNYRLMNPGKELPVGVFKNAGQNDNQGTSYPAGNGQANSYGAVSSPVQRTNTYNPGFQSSPSESPIKANSYQGSYGAGLGSVIDDLAADAVFYASN